RRTLATAGRAGGAHHEHALARRDLAAPTAGGAGVDLPVLRARPVAGLAGRGVLEGELFLCAEGRLDQREPEAGADVGATARRGRALAASAPEAAEHVAEDVLEAREDVRDVGVAAAAPVLEARVPVAVVELALLGV